MGLRTEACPHCRGTGVEYGVLADLRFRCQWCGATGRIPMRPFFDRHPRLDALTELALAGAMYGGILLACFIGLLVLLAMTTT